ncbi:MAG: hypothetical protein R3Y11_10595 [Pseudomonadota bacterium]
MVDMGAIKGLQATFHDIGRSTVSMEKNEDQGVAFGRNVSSPAKAAQGGSSVEQNNRAVMGTILGKLKDAGANARLMRHAEMALNKLDQSKPLTGRNVERAMGQIKKAAVMVTKLEMSMMKGTERKAQDFFKNNMSTLLEYMSGTQGHDGAPPSKQAMDIMKDAFLKLCKLSVQDAGVPPTYGKMHSFMQDIGQSFLNRDTNKTISNACTVLRTRLEGGQSLSEMAFHEKAAERGMNIPLDSNARNLLNTMWRAECQETFSGGQPHKPAEGELEKVLDTVLEKFFNRAALSFEGPQTQHSTTVLNHSHGPSYGPSQGPTVESQEKKAHVDSGASTASQMPYSTVHDDKKIDDDAATEAKTDVKPASIDDTQAKTEAKPDTKAEAKPETKPEEVKPEPKPEAKPQEEVKPEPKPQDEVKPDVQPEVKPDVKPASTPDSKPDVKPDDKADDKVQAEVKGPTKPIDPGLAKVIQATKELEDLRELVLAEAMQDLEEDYNAGHFDADLGYDLFDTMHGLQDTVDELSQSTDEMIEQTEAFLHEMNRK